MNNLLKTVLFISVLALTTSCSEDVAPASVVGKWKFASFGTKTDFKDFQITLDETLKHPEYKESGLTLESFKTLTFEFLADSSFISSDSKGKWSLSKDKKSLTIKSKDKSGANEVQEFVILEGTNTQLKLAYKKVFTKKAGEEEFSNSESLEDFIV